MSKSRDIWIDYVKVFACVLVTLGHFFQSMTKSELIPASTWTHWFNDTIYLFHVPLFFICSGFLYQKYSRIHSFTDWKNHILKKLITLGIPYLAFSIITWLLKTVLSGDVNTKNDGLLVTLFVEPVAPYWFLYGLFLMFLLIPTFRGRATMTVTVVVAAIWKIVFCWTGELPVYMLSRFMGNAVWFVFGMVLAATNMEDKFCGRKWIVTGGVLAAVFLTLTVVLPDLQTNYLFAAFGMSVLACSATVLIAISCKQQPPALQFMTHYTMPVFLMHTIFAAGWRIVLTKLGVSSGVTHIVTGLAISFAGPVIAAWMMGKVKGLDFVINPGRYVQLGKKNNARYNRI